jgi:hypothetical protein
MSARATGTFEVTLVPDTATGELAGLTGTMTIDVAEGTHRYTLEYTLGS